MKKKNSEEVMIQPSLAKKLLRANKNVGKLSGGIPDIVAYTGELFLADLIKKVTKDGTTALTAAALADTIESNKEYDFLLPLVPEIRNAAHEEGNKSRKAKSEE